MSQPDLTVRFPYLCYLGHLWAMTLHPIGVPTDDADSHRWEGAERGPEGFSQEAVAKK